ncbi:heterokaryon incompatibility protein-domain-containing protein [Cercophora newfieldiana]|uniref:Heterokaryon incompatibility protein-domain-containing protein n=1 Tax=Cercophora newfieldiana TaxID=92897 RepID=A0AA39YGH7_9PEZI|nr:heterokaryon incompatibility protein-domain-containing protein [Cercophora newfieldiana]
MRLLNAATLQLEDVFEDEASPYAILSHTWGASEVTFQEIHGLHPLPEHTKAKEGYAKIAWTCRQALKDNLTHTWVDTCCIDKTSSAELSEAINSMYRWYQRAAVCYVYLADLLAPVTLRFYSLDWRLIGIDPVYLSSLGRQTGNNIHSASIAERMSWVAGRHTTRTEDIAYCMLGILDVNMPLLYGEGEAAFIRLQEEIIKHSDDKTIFAWDLPQQGQVHSPAKATVYQSALAPSPAAFAQRGNLVPRAAGSEFAHFALTNSGLHLQARLAALDGPGTFLMLLCGPKDDPAVMLSTPSLSCHLHTNFFAS